jgi:hypothetical protein
MRLILLVAGLQVLPDKVFKIIQYNLGLGFVVNDVLTALPQGLLLLLLPDLFGLLGRSVGMNPLGDSVLNHLLNQIHLCSEGRKTLPPSLTNEYPGRRVQVEAVREGRQ